MECHDSEPCTQAGVTRGADLLTGTQSAAERRGLRLPALSLYRVPVAPGVFRDEDAAWVSSSAGWKRG
jgi:hypothetical protein